MSHLIEPGTKYFLSESLRQSHHVKMQYYNSYFNLGCVVGIFIIICAVLWWKYKGRKTPFEIEEKEREKQIYVMSLLQKYQQAKIKESQANITNLPEWDETEIIQMYHNLK